MFDRYHCATFVHELENVKFRSTSGTDLLCSPSNPAKETCVNVLFITDLKMTASATVSSLAGILLGFILWYPTSIDGDSRLESNIACLTWFKNELPSNRGEINIELYTKNRDVTKLYCAYHVKHLAFKNAIPFYSCTIMWEQIYGPEGGTPPESCKILKDILYWFSTYRKEEIIDSLKKLFKDENLESLFSIDKQQRYQIMDEILFDCLNFKKNGSLSLDNDKTRGETAYNELAQKYIRNAEPFSFEYWCMKYEDTFILITEEDSGDYETSREPYSVIDYTLAQRFWKNADDIYKPYDLNRDGSKVEEILIDIIRDMEIEKYDHYKERITKSSLRDAEDSGRGFELKVNWKKLKRLGQ